MEEITCFTHLLPAGETKQLTFWDILLDDRWTEGNFICPDKVYSEIGNLNEKLKAKQNYEFLLRASEKYSIKAIGQSEFHENTNIDIWEAFRTDCYVVGKYQEKLRENNCFDTIVTILIEHASNMPWYQDGISFLEKMIGRTPEYYTIDDNTRPILLYYGADICLNLLNLFIDSLADAFCQLSQPVELFDARMETTQGLTKYIGKHFKAIIGVQTTFFSIMMQDGITNLHDLIIGPKLNIILDHPAWLKNEINHGPKDYYLLLHDRNYISFATQHFPNVTGCMHFSPAGLLPTTQAIPMAFREYDITFIGSYRDYRKRLAVIRSYDRIHRHVAAHYLKLMHRNPDYPAEKALMETMKHYGIPMNSESFLQLFYDMRQVYFCILLYYREKVIQTLLDAGIPVHVFSDSWKNAPFINHPCLTCHPDIDAGLSLRVMQNSKLSLNIMSWHKDGLTERIFNGMLCESVVLSDRTTALEEEFVPNEDLVLFSLAELSQLPDTVKSLLADNDRLRQIASSGNQKALNKHTWLERARQILRSV